jgi:16S rRNA (uracil1498-N3)-methyltransferase
VQSGWAARAGAAAHTFVDRLDDALTLEGDAARHLAGSLRLRPGECVTAADGHGRWRAYEVGTVDRYELHLAAGAPVVVEPRLTPAVCVAFALTKADKPDLVVQKLTELGVDRIVLVRAARSVPRWDAARTAAAVARLERVAREAAQQCRRATLPEVAGIETPASLADRPGLVVADPSGAGPTEVALPGTDEWALAVGPEGGFDPDELAAMPGPRLGLGPYVLRAETAAIAGAAALCARRATDA